MDEMILEVGVGGIFSLLVLREVLPFVRRNGKGNGNHRRFSTDCALSKVCEMRHESLRDLIVHVNDNLTAQTALLREVARDVEVLKGKVS